MKLIRFRLRPKSPWMTPWQADTIAGLLAVVYAREAPESAEKELIEPWRNGRPTLVVSDAFPGDLLPAPADLSLRAEVREEERKTWRSAAWLSRAEFRLIQEGRMPKLEEMQRADPFQQTVRLRNSIDRSVNSTGESGELYEAAGEVLKTGEYLSIYARVEEGRESWAGELFTLLGQFGYGADARVGAGEVEIVGGPEPVSELDSAESGGGWVSLSTFQPAPGDPTEGYWRSFVKYGKLGPDIPVSAVFKRPQWMLRAGACFREGSERRDWYGRWIPANALFPVVTAEELRAQGVEAGQPAYALAVPLRWSSEDK